MGAFMLKALKRFWDETRGVQVDLHDIVAKGPRNNREFVVELVKHFDARRVAEVGVWKGQLSRMLLEQCPLDHLTMVDPLEMQRNFFESSSQGPHPTMMDGKVYNCRMGESTLTQAQLDEVHRDMVAAFRRDFPGRSEFIRLPSVKGSQRIAEGSLDLVFIDAIHLYEDVLEDIAAWLPKVKPNGILAGDDYSTAFQGVIDAVNETFPDRIRRIHPETGVWYVRNSDVRKGGCHLPQPKTLRKAS